MTVLAAIANSDIYTLTGLIAGAAITAYGAFKAATYRTREDRAAVASDRGSVELTAEVFKSAIEGLASAADAARHDAARASELAATAQADASASRDAVVACEAAREADRHEWQAKYATLEGVVDDLVSRVPGAGQPTS